MFKRFFSSEKKAPATTADTGPKKLNLCLVGGRDFQKNFMWTFIGENFHQNEYASSPNDTDQNVIFCNTALKLRLRAEHEGQDHLRPLAYPGMQGFILPFIAGTEKNIEQRFSDLTKLVAEIKYHDLNKPIVVFCFIPDLRVEAIHTCHQRLTSFCNEKGITYVGAQEEYQFNEIHMRKLCAIAGGYQNTPGSFNTKPPEIIEPPKAVAIPVTTTTSPKQQASQSQSSMFAASSTSSSSKPSSSQPAKPVAPTYAEYIDECRKLLPNGTDFSTDLKAYIESFKDKSEFLDVALGNSESFKPLAASYSCQVSRKTPRLPVVINGKLFDLKEALAYKNPFDGGNVDVASIRRPDQAVTATLVVFYNQQVQSSNQPSSFSLKK